MKILLCGILAMVVVTAVIVSLGLLLEEGEREGLINRGYAGEDVDADKDDV